MSAKRISVQVRAAGVILGMMMVSNPASSRAEDEAAADGEKGHVRKPLPPAEEIAKLPPDGGDEFNRLVFEKSPYLLQHARNPVDWWPWSEEAFRKAAAEDKPVLLSVGYTTCHWCHVMEHESFEDPEVAKMVNEWFVPIKVDREERPDIDEIYMTVTQAMTGSGGWPMTVVMTPDKKPFFAGTYFPKEDRLGRKGFKSLLTQLHQIWTDERERALEVAGNVANALGDMMSGSPGDELGEEHLAQAFRELKATYDAEHGGFGKAPKFPTAPNLSFLLRHWKRTGEAEALEMVRKTLHEIRLGGVYDQVGLGVHRYSTDAEWLLPHFEKMLYDQALLSIAALEAYQATGEEEFATLAREIFTYVLRDMTSENGGFYSAEDADSEGEEGTFYVWTPTEVKEVLGDEEGDLFCSVFDIVEGGNFREEATGRPTGASIPHLRKPLTEMAGDLGIDPADLARRIEASRAKLFDHREKRVHPQKDDKVLTDWNGLMIAAMARGGEVLGDESLTAAARKAADFVLTTLRTDDGRLLKRYRDGEAGLTAHLEDYAFMVWALIELYEATFDPSWLEQAVALNARMIELFRDPEGGGLFMTAEDSEELLVRAKKIYGGAIPSGNAVAALNFLRLARLTGQTDLEERYAELIKAFSGDVGRQPSSFPQLMIAVDFAVGPAYEVVIAGKSGAGDVAEMVKALRQPFFPNKVILFKPDDPEAGARIAKIAPFTAEQKSLDGKATAYVCRNFACNLPTDSIAKMREFLGIEK